MILGGDDIDQLVEADETEFKEITELVGMSAKPLHVKRLRKAIDEYKNAFRFDGKFISFYFVLLKNIKNFEVHLFSFVINLKR